MKGCAIISCHRAAWLCSAQIDIASRIMRYGKDILATDRVMTDISCRPWMYFYLFFYVKSCSFSG